MKMRIRDHVNRIVARALIAPWASSKEDILSGILKLRSEPE